MERIPIREHPYLFDKAAQRVQKALGANVVWLEHIFGLAERITREINGKKYVLPNIWTGNNDYMDLMPDSLKGSFSFCYLDEPQSNSDGRMTATMELVVWYDTRAVDADLRDTERVKAQILDALDNLGGVTVKAVYDRPSSVYKGFTFDTEQELALMHPFAGLRVSMDVYVERDCNPYV